MEAVVLFFISFLLLVTGCVSPGASPAATHEAAAVSTLELSLTSLPTSLIPIITSALSVQPTPGLTPIAEPLSPEPQTVEFQAADGQVLHGFYYPPALKPAPLVVLMHWLPGDQHDWDEIAPWLQKRGLVGKSSNAGKQTWLDPTWFPPMLAGQSLAVFTFSFRGCEG